MNWRIILKRVCRRLQLEKENLEERSLAPSFPLERIIGTSAKMKDVFAAVRKVASTDVPVLILGESEPVKNWLPWPFIIKAAGKTAPSPP